MTRSYPNGLTRFTTPRFTLSDITPVTYRDGESYASLLWRLFKHITEVLNPELETSFRELITQLETEMEKAEHQYVDGVQEFQRIHDAFMADVNAHLIALNDGAVSDLVNDDTSMLGETLRAIFPDNETFDAFKVNINEQHQALADDVDTFKQDTNTTLDTFTTATNDRLDQFNTAMGEEFTRVRGDVDDAITNVQRDVSDQFDAANRQTLERLETERKLSDQTDMVDVLTNRSNLGHLELVVTGSGDYPAFSVYRTYEAGNNGLFAETSFIGGDQSGNDEYHRIWETHIGTARTTDTPGRFTYERSDKLTPASNHEFALRFKPASRPTETVQWVPRHNNINTAFRARDPLFMTPNGRLRVIEGDDTRAQIDGHLDIIQHVYGRHPSTGDQNLLEIWTTHRFYPDGSIHLSGRWKALQDVIFDSGYVLMLPGTPNYVRRVVTSLGNAYANVSDKYGTSDRMVEEGDQAKSYGFVMANSRNFSVGVTYDNIHETLRRDAPGKPDDPAFTEHRNDSIVKIYNQLFDGETLVKAGTTHRFSGRYVHAYSPQINEYIDVI